MNIEYANSIPLRVILSKMGYKPIQSTNRELRYRLSDTMFAEDLIVDTGTNTWSVPMEHLSGDVIALVCLNLKANGENDTKVDALRWIKNMVGYAILNPPQATIDYANVDSIYLAKDVSFISCPILLKYLEEQRGIPFDYARFILKQISIVNSTTKKMFNALGVQNEEGGFAIRNPYVKAHIGPTSITFIRGQVVRPTGIHIFKDIYDYLSLVTYRKGEPLENDAMILNSVHCMKVSAAYIRNYGYQNAFTWFDNTEEGRSITDAYDAFIQSEPDLKHVRMNSLYKSSKDFNEFILKAAATRREA